MISANERGISRRELFLIGLLVLIGFALRLHMLLQGGSIIDADEAIVGLMAKHIVEGKPWPIFYYGQPYMGSLEAICAALSFQLFGMSGFSLKLVPLLFSLLHIALVYLLSRRFFGMLASGVAACLTALGPAGLITWSSMARGGFIELVCLGTIALILAVDILKLQTSSVLRFFGLGLVLGLGWWTNNQMIFYMIPIALVLGAWALAQFPVRESASAGVSTIFGFLIGSAPFWYYNLAVEPRFQTFTVLTQQQTETGFLQHLGGYFSEAMPIILGARRFWSDNDVFPHASLAVLVLYCICLFICFTRRIPTGRDGDRGDRASFLLIGLFLLIVPLVFSASSFGWLSKAPRYLLPLYSVLFLLVGGAFEWLWAAGSSVSRSASILLFLGVVTVNIASNFFGELAIPGQPFVANGERVAADHTELYRFLESERYFHIWTNYWIGYRVAFETAERVTFSRFGTPRSLRLPQYEEDDGLSFEDEIYVLVPSQARKLAPILTRMGYLFRQQAVGSYVVIDQLRPEVELGAPLTLRADQLKTTSRGEWASRMIDNDPGTRWGSGMPQQAGMGVEVWFDGLTGVAGLELDYGRYVSDVPRHLVVLGLKEDGSWCEIVDLGGFEPEDALQEVEHDESPRVMRMHFAPQNIRALHLEERDGGKGPFDWSIAELRVYPPLR